MNKTFTWIKKHGLILSIIAIGFALRIIGLQFGKPFRYHPDELKLVYWAGNLLQYQSWSKDTLFLIGIYPPFFGFILTFAFGLYSVLLVLLNLVPDFASVKSLYYTNPFQYHMIARWISVLAGTLSIGVIYKIGKQLYSRFTGLLAALFLSFSFLHIRNSHFGVVDALLILLILLSFYFSARILKGPRLKNYVLAAAFAAMATATKWNAGLIVLPLIMAHFTTDSSVFILKRILDRKIWIAGAVAVVVFLGSCPLPLLDFNEFWGGIIGTARFQQMGTKKLGAGGGFFSYFTGDHSPGYGLFYDNNFIQSLGIFVTILFVAGTLYLLWRHKKQDILLLIFPIFMYLLVGNMQYKAMRHVLPMVPFLLLIAAEFLVTIRLLAKRLVFQRIVTGLIVFATVVPPAWKALQYDIALCQPDTRTIMKDWIEAHIPFKSKIGLEEFHPPLLAEKDVNLQSILKSADYSGPFDLYGLVPKMFSHGKQRTTKHNPVNYIVENQLAYLVLDSFTHDRYHWENSKRKNPEAVAERDSFNKWVENNCLLLFTVEQNNQFNISPKLKIYKVNVLSQHDEIK
jgi:hypothetical protein